MGMAEVGAAQRVESKYIRGGGGQDGSGGSGGRARKGEDCI
jgi:hypothetical protein